MKKIIFTLCMGLMSGSVFAAAPVKSPAVTHPKTTVTVTHPTTNTVVTHPQAAVAVTRPATEVAVSHPTTTVVVKHPQTPSAVTADSTQAVAEPTKQAVDNAAPAAAAKGSMMSSYQAPKAKDLKASALGGGEAGLGNKTNQAEKDAVAAQTKKPEALTFENALKGSGISKSKLTKDVENKLK